MLTLFQLKKNISHIIKTAFVKKSKIQDEVGLIYIDREWPVRHHRNEE